MKIFRILLQILAEIYLVPPNVHGKEFEISRLNEVFEKYLNRPIIVTEDNREIIKEWVHLKK